MDFVTRVGWFVALVFVFFTFFTGQSWADNGHDDSGWPKPFGHGLEGPLLDRVDPFGFIGFEYDASDSDAPGAERSHTGMFRGALGANFQLAELLSATAEVRTGDDFREARLDFGGGNYDQNLDFSLSQLNLRWEPEVPFVRGLGLTAGRQPLILPGNVLYPATVFDEDLRLDGAQLDWDCGCDEWDLDTETSVGIFALNRSGENGFINTDNIDSETARLLTVGSSTRWAPVETFDLQTFFNYYHYDNVKDGFDAFTLQQTGIVDKPNIIHTGLNTTIELLGVPITLSGEYINNLDADDEEQAFTAGLGIDLEACNRLHRISYVYQSVEAWSIVSGFAQDDHRTLRSGYDGHVIQGTFHTTDNLTFDLEAFIAEPNVPGVDEDQEQRIRFGLNYRFD